MMNNIQRPNRVRELLKQGKMVYGCRSFTTYPAFIEIMGWTGFDFVSIDTEHSPADAGATLPGIQACELSGTTPLVRIYEINPPLICKVLDNGARGVMVPHVSTASQAEEVVRSVKFPPLGERSACPLTRAAQYGLHSLSSLKEYYHKANEDTLVILSIEGVEGIKNTPEILKVKGVDIIGLGVGDLSHSMGIAGETYDNPKLYGALKDMVKMCSEVGIPVMTPMYQYSSSKAAETTYAKKIADAGVKVIYLGSDLSLFGRTCQELIKIREVL